MSLHIAAARDEIASTVLIPGDPMRAQFIADQMLTEVRCYNRIRGMLGFTGLYKGKPVSVQGTGIGIPSTAIYIHELVHDYRVQTIVRIGTCGALQPELQLDQLILANGAYTDSCTQFRFHDSADIAAEPDPALLEKARMIARQHSMSVVEGPVFSTDLFYDDDAEKRWAQWRARGILAVEMESSILYHLARKYNIAALSILSVSDNVVTGTSQTPKDREEASRTMMQLALEIAYAL